MIAKITRQVDMLGAIQRTYESEFSGQDEVTRKDKTRWLTEVCAKCNISFRAFIYLERYLITNFYKT